VAGTTKKRKQKPKKNEEKTYQKWMLHRVRLGMKNEKK